MLLCVSIPGPDLASVREQMTQAAAYANVLELRVDLFDSIPVSDLVLLKRQCSLPVMLTLKSQRQGGAFSDDVVGRYTYLKHLSVLHPELIDIEVGTPRSDVLELKKLLPNTHFVISYHDIHGSDVNLIDTLHAMQQLPGHYYKIVTTAHSIEDSLHILEFMRTINRNGRLLCGICMGAVGSITRILAPTVGSPFTYASLNDSLAVAPGQVPAVDLRDIYGIQRLNEDSRIMALIGNPVDTSKGYIVHNAVFKALGAQAVYVKARVNPSELASFLERVNELKWHGFSVTMPLKEAIIPLLDVVDPAAAAAGAVNTVVRDERGLVGYNFDGVGAIDAIEAKLSGGINGKRVIVIGAGGAAKAIVYEAKQRGADVLVVNRSLERAEALAIRLGVYAKPFESLPDILQSGPDVVIQATSVGMAPNGNATLVNPNDLQSNTLVFDVIATPIMTRLLLEAQQKGCVVVTGAEMWVRQAEMQLSLWLKGLVNIDRLPEIVNSASKVYRV